MSEVDNVVDALGNPIVFGAEYCCTIYGSLSVDNAKVFGVATAVLHGKTGVKITLALTESIAYRYGERLPDGAYRQRSLGKVSYHPAFLFPTGRVPNVS